MPVRSLRQEEAVERAALVSVTSYDIRIDLTDMVDGPPFRAVSTIRFSGRAGATTFVDCCAEVESATLNGVPLPEAEEGRITLPDLAEDNELVVATVQADTTHGRGVHRAVDPGDDNVYVWTTFEPDEARYAWACFDQPDLKAPHAFTVTAPAGWTVVSNSGDPVVEDVEGGRRWTFEPTPPLSTYNPVVVAGPFVEQRKQAGGHDLGLFARRTLASALERDAEQLFTLTEQGLGFFGERFGMPFPQRSYDQVFLPDFGGAMENYGCVTWADTVLRRSEPTTGEWQVFATVLLHEMAHMWFGNIVTMRWWDDLWLNEAFAEFACMWAAERATAYGDTAANNLVEDKLNAYLADQGPASHPIRMPVPSVADAESIFDSITYPKGAAVLKQLMHFVGEDTFGAGMTAYFAEHAWGNTTLDDLIGSLEQASGRDLQPWRTAWLETAGVDRLGVEQSDQGLVLTAAGAHGAPHPQVVGVGAYRRAGDTLEEVGSVHVEVSGERTTIDGLPHADLYLVNHDDTTFATTRPDATGREVLVGRPSGLPTTLTRAVAIATVWDMLSNGEATAAEAVGALTDVLSVETVETVAEPVLQLAVTAAQAWSPEAERAGLEARVGEAARHLLEAGVSRTSALRALARTAAGDDDLEAVRREAGDDVDLQWYVLQRRAELGELDAAAVQALQEQDPDPDAWIRALTVRAGSPSAEAKLDAWTALVSREVPIQSARTVAAAFWRPGQDDVLAPYADRYLEALPHFHEGGMIPGLALTAALFPVHAVDEAWVGRAREVAAAHAAPVVVGSLTERSEAVLRMMRARAL
ncbi:aminopeptidase N [Nocardioides exalbidus]|uniref:Aminopeptidase N n=1 Tax=Nocardioides exalbidus TaxID=402596 RepID=A0A1H4Z960_9ACTN|nr:aminopeptidase N [Nocardioides exalbidus]SED25951.1 aminopeptidase N [Nocardioides exalbidus]